MPQNLIRVKQIDQPELSGFLIQAVESTSLYQQLTSGIINFNSGSYYFYVNPKTVESNKSFIIGPSNYVSGDDTNNHIFGGLFNSIGSGNLTSLIIGGESNLLSRGIESNSIIASDFSQIDAYGFNNGILFGLFNYVTGTSGDRNIIIGGAYNLIGTNNNETNAIIAGQNNTLNGTQSVIIGGNYNYSSGYNQFLMTDFGIALDDYVSLIGGKENTIYGGKHNSIINGYFNLIDHPANYTGNFTGANTILNSWKSNISQFSIFNTIIGGGYHNTSGFALVLVGGYLNKLTGDYSFLGGGYSNVISGSASNINGGAYNTIRGNYSSILGGRDNLLSGNDSFSIGRNNQIFSSGAGIISDGTNRNKILNNPNTLNIDFQNQINIYSNSINITGNKILSGPTTFSGESINLIDTALNLSGVGDMTFTGVNISFINSPVYISGTDLRLMNNALVSGNLYVNQTGIFNAVDLNNIDNINLSGVDVTIQNATVDLNNSTLINAMPQFVNESTNFIISGNDNGRVILANSSSQINGIIVSGNSNGFNTSIIQIGTGQIQITGSGSNVLISSYNNQFRTAGQFATISLLHTGNNRYIMYGNTI
jgi:hypothetical protein